MLHIIIMYKTVLVKGERVRQKANEELKQISVYIPTSLHDRIAELAASERRSVSAEVVVLLEKTVPAETKAKRG